MENLDPIIYIYLFSPRIHRMEKEMATHSRRIPWREEPGRLQPMGSQRV